MILVTGAPTYPWLHDEAVKGDIADYDLVEALLRFDRPAILNFVWPGHDRRCAIDAGQARAGPRLALARDRFVKEVGRKTSQAAATATQR
ncbi:hypothetical protein GGE45_001464 [Rhizobium aethiopicum]|uniref:Uncharacterized protein n=1 Tax=Rhizobium aethiopicum TaxID=1138170 RepID=A0A7W6MHG1_9HYPH|nr:hypothetical protein [Rhizobium aethiopicum]MBB4579144.1 hypothetical protein [Rhizobium aethiopicum]